MLLGDAGSHEKGKFMTTGEYSRLKHHFSKGHFKSCTDMLLGGGGGGRHQIHGCVITSATAVIRLYSFETSSDRTEAGNEAA